MKSGRDLYFHLRRKKKKYRKRGKLKDTRGKIKNRVSIEHRPKIVDKKERFGDLEIDTVIGKNYKKAFLTINDRVSRRVWIRLLQSENADELSLKTIETLDEFKDKLHTVTADNGKEFAKHEKIAKELNIDFFFARPYHSWERGANENTNGLIRQYFPKKSSFENISEEMVKEIETKINNRPRKCLNFYTPMEVFNNHNLIKKLHL